MAGVEGPLSRDPPEEGKRKPDQKSYLEEVEARWAGRKLVEGETRGLVWAFAEGPVSPLPLLWLLPSLARFRLSYAQRKPEMAEPQGQPRPLLLRIPLSMPARFFC